MWFDQSEYEIRCEWGERGVEALAPISDVVIVVDALSFTTCVEIATTRGAVIHPCGWKDGSAAELSRALGAELAGPRGKARFSLSPRSFLDVPPGTRIVLPSPNGAPVSLATGQTPALAGCFRNARAVAQAARRFGERVAVVPAGERWADGTLRPALEDWLAAGAIIAHLAGSLSPEAEGASAQFKAAQPYLAEKIGGCVSGRELIARGFPEDVVLAAQLDVSAGVPVLVDGAYT